MGSFAQRVGVKFFAILCVILFVGNAGAAIYISNSSDWRIPYILGYYAVIHGDYFLAADSEQTARNYIPDYLVTLTRALPGTNGPAITKEEEIVIVEYEPFVKNLEALIRAKGFTNVKTIKPSSPDAFMFEFPESIGIPLDHAVIVPQSSGEWVLSAGPLAQNLNAYILLLTPQNMDDVVSFVRAHSVPSQNVYVVGYAGKRMKDYFPDAHFIATGSKIKDSAEIANIILSLNPDVDTIYVMSGYFLYVPPIYNMPPFWADRGIPVVISYLDHLPEEVINILSQDRIKAIIFQGPELGPVFDQAKSLFADKGKTIRMLLSTKFVSTKGFDPNADYLPPHLMLPSANVRIDVEKVRVLPDGRVFITFRNLGDASGYVLPSYISLECGEDKFEISSTEPIFVDAKDSAIVDYNALEGAEVSVIPRGTCKAYVEFYYGPDIDRMEIEQNKTVSVVVQGVNDPSKIEVTRVVYSPRLERFIIYVKNVGEIPTYVTVYLKDVLIDGVPTEVKTRTTLVKADETKKLYAKAFLTDADILDNPEVKYVARFGRDSGLPVHVLSGTLPLEKETLQDIVLEFIQENYLLVAAALVLIILLLIFFRKR